MKLFSHKKYIQISPPRFNPHLYWTWLLIIFILALSLELIWFSWFFVETTRKLDEPVYPTLETNAVKIRNLERKIKLIDEAVEVRVGNTQLE